MVSCNTILHECKLMLTELTFNDDVIIANLSKLAYDYLMYAHDIVPIIESHLSSASPPMKLPIFYLIDSIMKNVGRDYTTLFSNNLAKNFCRAYKQVDDQTRLHFLELRKTWNCMIPFDILFEIDSEISKLASNKSSNFQLHNNSRNVTNFQLRSNPRWHSNELPVVTGIRRGLNDNHIGQRNKIIRREENYGHTTNPRTENGKFNSNSENVCYNDNNTNNRREKNYRNRNESKRFNNRNRRFRVNEMNRQNEAHFGYPSDYNYPIPPLPFFDSSVPPPNFSQETQAPPALNVQELLKQLAANGIILPNSQTSHSNYENNVKISFDDLSSLQSRKSSEKMWFSGKQCNFCGLRFHQREKDEYNNHMENHSTANLKLKETPIIRNWYYNKLDWINNVKVLSFKQKEKNNADENQKKIPCAVAEPFVAVTKCCVCTDTFECFFDDDEDEWLLRNAIRRENQVFHPLCYDEHTISHKYDSDDD